MKKGDIILLVCAAVLGLLPLLTLLTPAAAPGTAIVRIDGDIARAFPLSRDAQETFSAHGGSNTVVISGGTVSISHADCPDRTCVNMGGISRTGEVLVCLPHHLTVSIEGASEAVDAVTQ